MSVEEWLVTPFPLLYLLLRNLPIAHPFSADFGDMRKGYPEPKHLDELSPVSVETLRMLGIEVKDGAQD